MSDHETDLPNLFECPCCCYYKPWCSMIQCPAGHVLCPECVTRYAEHLLVKYNPKIVCIDQSGCKLLFPDSQLRLCFDPTLWGSLERVRSRREIEMAKLEGWEECPCCDYGVQMGDPERILFECLNCGEVTCRKCKMGAHPFEPCVIAGGLEEHYVEESMTNALVRKCPHCQIAFVKESGCNHITCEHDSCKKESCYVCREIIEPHKWRYHFGANKCPLFDVDWNVENTHEKEVLEAKEKAEALQEQYQEMKKRGQKTVIPKEVREAEQKAKELQERKERELTQMAREAEERAKQWQERQERELMAQEAKERVKQWRERQERELIAREAEEQAKEVRRERKKHGFVTGASRLVTRAISMTKLC